MYTHKQKSILNPCFNTTTELESGTDGQLIKRDEKYFHILISYAITNFKRFSTIRAYHVFATSTYTTVSQFFATFFASP